VTVALVAVTALVGCSSHPDKPRPAPPAVRSSAPTAPAVDAAALRADLVTLESRYGARIGVQVVDTATGATFGYRASERFALDSTSKVLTSAAVLREATDAQLGTVIHYDASDLQSYSPVTSQHVDDGMTLSDVIAAALQYSDNTAANLLFEQLGGPASAQARVRDWGDDVSTLDRLEPDLNSAVPGDPRDTTTPAQMARDLRMLALGDTLPAPRRALLVDTMLGNTTGASYIRAGVPATWRVADKTGNGGYGSRNDVAVLYPPGDKPIVLAIYTTRKTEDASSDDDLIAAITKDVAAALA
jgi:beta-lactamase class A